jgi:hypothetical protein
VNFTINDTGWRTPNISRHNDGTPIVIQPQGMMAHTCEGGLPSPRATSLPYLTKQGSGVSCNYYVCRNAEIFQLAEDYHRTWHAGIGTWPGISDGNKLLGVEFEHRQGMDWPDVQIEAGAWLFRTKIAEYSFPRERIIAHRWWAPGRKIDPTNWSDPALKAWIADLYEPNWTQLWGGHAVYTPHFAIPIRWRHEYDAGRPLGMALAPEFVTPSGLTVQPFERGFITWSSVAGTRVWREQP